jgi:hypothetical protein
MSLMNPVPTTPPKTCTETRVYNIDDLLKHNTSDEALLADRFAHTPKDTRRFLGLELVERARFCGAPAGASPGALDDDAAG